MFPQPLWRFLQMLSLLAAPAAVAAQDRVSFEITLSSDSTERGTRAPLVRTANLLSDSRWTSMLHSGFPLRLHYRLELWRSRASWVDAFERQVEWDVVVRHEPLLDQYTLSRVVRTRRSESRYTDLESLARALSFSYRVAVEPDSRGLYYYAATLQISTLSDSDLEELERFLEGDLGPVAGGGQNFGDAVGRGATRLLLRLAGLPSLRLETKTKEFRVR